MTGEMNEQTTPKPPTQAELLARYGEEARREHGGTMPHWDGETQDRYEAASAGVEAVFGALRVHNNVQGLSDGTSGILSAAQVEAIDAWRVAHQGLLGVSSQVEAALGRGTFVGMVEGFVVDMEEAAATGLEIFQQPEAAQPAQ